jgi:hypothetical protein
MGRSRQPLGSARTQRQTATAHGSSPRTQRGCSTRDQAITALTLAERFAAGFGDDDPFVKTWRKELFL